MRPTVILLSLFGSLTATHVSKMTKKTVGLFDNFFKLVLLLFLVKKPLDTQGLGPLQGVG